MPDERRKARRARIPGMRVVFESAAGERVEADVLDVGSAGLFIRTARPLAPGKRVSLEVQGVPGLAAWSAHGRVVWTREVGTKDAAPGMGVKIIDADEAVVTAIDGLVDAREGTQSPTAPREAPVREPTVLGLGEPEKPAVAASPIVPVAPERERTVLGVGAAGAPAAVRAPERERSAQEPPPGDWDLPDPHEMPTRENIVPQRVVAVSRDEAPQPEPLREPEPPAAPSPEASIAIDLVARKPQADVDEAPLPPLPRRRGGLWLLLLVLAAASAAVALYVMRGRIPWVQRLVDTWTASPPAPAPVVPPPSASTEATPIPVPSPVASPTASGAASARVIPSAGPSTAPAPSKAPLPASAAPAPVKRPAGDNPYG